MARIYPDDLLPVFRGWLQATYIPGQFPEYVRQKCSTAECAMIAGAIGSEVKPVLRRSAEAREYSLANKYQI